MGEWTESSEDDSSTERDEAPSVLKKKLKLSLYTRKVIDYRRTASSSWTKRKSRHSGQSSYPRTLLALNGLRQTLLLGEMAETLDLTRNPRSGSR